MTAEVKITSFESKLNSIKEILEDLESPKLSLEERLSKFEEGTKLIKECQNVLQKADMKVQKIVEANNKLKLEETKV